MSQYVRVTAYGEEIAACDHWGEQEKAEEEAAVLRVQQAVQQAKGDQKPKQTRKRRCCRCGENFDSAQFSKSQWRKYSYADIKCLYCQKDCQKVLHSTIKRRCCQCGENYDSTHFDKDVWREYSYVKIECQYCQYDLHWDSPRARTLVSSANVLNLPDDVKQSEHSFQYLTISLKHSLERSYFSDLFDFLKIADVHSIRILSHIPADVLTYFLTENTTLIYLQLGCASSDMEWWYTMLPSIFQTPNLQVLEIPVWFCWNSGRLSTWGKGVQDMYVKQREIYLLPKVVIDSNFWMHAAHKRKNLRNMRNQYKWAIRRGIRTTKVACETLCELMECLEPTLTRAVSLLILEFSRSYFGPLLGKTICLHVPHDVSNTQILKCVRLVCNPFRSLGRRRNWLQSVIYFKVSDETAEFLLKIGEVEIPGASQTIAVTETDVAL